MVQAAYGGVALAAAAVVMLFLVMFFGDVFLKSDRDLRRWMDSLESRRRVIFCE